MGHGAHKIYAVTMASASNSMSVDLTRAYAKVYLQVPTMTSNSAFDVYASVDGSSYYQVRRETLNTATAGATFIVAATAAVNGGIAPIPAGFRYYKFIATDSAPTASTGFYVVCGDN